MNVLVTGANGFLGRKIIKEIIRETDYNVLGLVRSLEHTEEMLDRENITQRERITFITNDEFLHSEKNDWDIYGAVHLAFSRRMQPAADIASSVKFSADVFHKLSECRADHVINMSSQGIYGNTEEIRYEDTIPAPNTQYTMAKYATEILFDDILKDCPHHTNLRLDPVAQTQNVLKGLCNSANDGTILLKGTKQVFSFIDALDASKAVVAMLKAEGKWERVYNVGWNKKRYTLVELATIVANAAEKSGFIRPEIKIEEQDIALWAGMDSTRFMEKTGWKPTICIEETILEMLRL